MTPAESRPFSEQAGLSLVEVLTASTILGLVITAMMAVLANVARMDASADQFRQARIFIMEEIEDPHRHFSRYSSLSGYSDYPGLRLDVNPQAGYTGIPAEAAVRVADADSVIINGVEVPYKRMQASITWIDHDRNTQTLILGKRVARTK